MIRGIPLVSFTGSSAVGRQINQRCAARFAKTILELSGNNALIVDETADLSQALPAIVFGAIGTAGQRCTSTRRLFIHRSLQQQLEQQLVHAYQQISIGDPLDPKHLMGPLIDEAAVAHYHATLKQAVKEGAEIVYGAKSLDGPGYYVQPTLMRAQNDYGCVQQETFAPILYMMAYDELDEAINLQNQVPQGLSSALFTRNLKAAERFLSAIGSDCGIANINIGTSGAEIGGAFGGEKDTGGGREAGSDAWKAYMRRQTNTINWGDELPLAQGIEFKL